jgi:2-methylcitrate dehydratase PrpD
VTAATALGSAIGGFVATLPSAEVPDAARHAARRAALDIVGIAIAGCDHPQVVGLRRTLEREAATGRATVIGTDLRWAPAAAAYANSVAAHVLGLDDFSTATRGHPACVIGPAALAVAQDLGRSDDEFLDAYAIGYEVTAALGVSLSNDQYERGWHPTATVGVFGATAAASRLLRLDAADTSTAFAIAAAFASGIRGSIGSFMNPGQVGFAAYKGVLAARLAADGLEANPRALDSEHSFAGVFNADPEPQLPGVESLGRVWSIVESPPVFGGATAADERRDLSDSELIEKYRVLTEGRLPDAAASVDAMTRWIRGDGPFVDVVGSMGTNV